jgi:hypothetical protein
LADLAGDTPDEGVIYEVMRTLQPIDVPSYSRQAAPAASLRSRFEKPIGWIKIEGQTFKFQ